MGVNQSNVSIRMKVQKVAADGVVNLVTIKSGDVNPATEVSFAKDSAALPMDFIVKEGDGSTFTEIPADRVWHRKDGEAVKDGYPTDANAVLVGVKSTEKPQVKPSAACIAVSFRENSIGQ